jgi:DNA processing protein
MTTLDLLTLTLVPGLGPRALRDLARGGGLDHALSEMATREHRERAQAQMELAARLGIRLLCWDEADYPARLLAIYDPPPVLFVRGTTVREETAVAVVGSRVASPLGRTSARVLARDLASAGVAVVSGLARGIDTAAHEGALAARGRTVAVLGSGLDRLYPRENEQLAGRIASAGGAVVSEFPLGTSPLPGHFPRRNRIIAGWSSAVVVVEAAERSGALVTARAAADEGREVCAVPGHPSHPGARGTNQLIRDGAALVRDAGDVLAELGLDPLLVKPAPTDDPLLGALRDDAPSSLEELHERSGREIPHLLARLAELELAEKVRRLPGGLFVRN